MPGPSQSGPPSSPFVERLKSEVTNAPLDEGHGRVLLTAALSEGENSSGKSIVVDGEYIPAHTTESKPAKIKIFTSSSLEESTRRAKH